ncbi:MAG: twin transmembrane helix small protein [Gammaproteobacteria bacterium]|nr:twin transmembrane helix small protein [Gammaproteobacteria bacterium]
MELLTVLIILALLATIASLGWGIGSMAHGGRFDDKHELQFMGARVGLQGVAIVLLLIAAFVAS